MDIKCSNSLHICGFITFEKNLVNSHFLRSENSFQVSISNVIHPSIRITPYLTFNKTDSECEGDDGTIISPIIIVIFVIIFIALVIGNIVFCRYKFSHEKFDRIG
jgi:hypothetical protein